MKIERLDIKTRKLKRQKEFYSRILNLEIDNVLDNSFEVKAGSSVLKFIEDSNATPYHIAFHIPPLKEVAALEWLKQRVEVQKKGKEEIIDFSAWNSKSVYFYDIDKNILEFISRKKLFPPYEQLFTDKSIWAIAEIGMATKDIPEKFKALNETCGLNKFDGNFEKFCAIGDDEGLIITIDKNKTDWFPHDKAYASEFEMIFKHEGKKFKLLFEKDILTITQPEF